MNAGLHVLCESPFSLNEEQWNDLSSTAKDANLVLQDGLKTAYSTAYSRMLLLAKSNRIGQIVSVDVSCTSLKKDNDWEKEWDPIFEWGPTALLPVFQLLGTDYKEKNIYAFFSDETQKHDVFSKIDYMFPHAVASIKIGNGVKSEGELIISGTKGYIYVPAPWWKTEYFEIRFENPAENKRFFYQLDGEGIRYELLCFLQSINKKQSQHFIERNISKAICKEIGSFYRREKIIII